MDPVSGSLDVAELRGRERLLDFIVVSYGDVVTLSATNEEGRSEQIERGLADDI